MSPKQRRAYNKGIKRRRLKRDADARRTTRKGWISRDDRPAEDDPIYQQMLREQESK